MHRRNFIKAFILSILGSFFPKSLLPDQVEELGWGTIVDSSGDVETWYHITGMWRTNSMKATVKLFVNGEYVGNWKPKHEIFPSPEGTVAYWMLPHDPDTFDPLHHAPSEIEYLLGLDLPHDEMHYLAYQQALEGVDDG